MPRFVILTHTHPAWHWDVMLEKEASLSTWKLHATPTGADPQSAQPLADHRLIYLDYEGTVSGDRGEVRQWDAGVFETISHDANCMVVRLSGRKLVGTAVFEKQNSTNFWTYRYVAQPVAQSANSSANNSDTLPAGFPYQSP